MDGLTVGRIVHFVMPDGDHRPAIVVRTWGGDCVQLQVFLDGTNDLTPAENGGISREIAERGLMWATSVPYSEQPQPRTWHWPERA